MGNATTINPRNSAYGLEESLTPSKIGCTKVASVSEMPIVQVINPATGYIYYGNSKIQLMRIQYNRSFNVGVAEIDAKVLHLITWAVAHSV